MTFPQQVENLIIMQVGKAVYTTQKTGSPSAKCFHWYTGLQFSITTWNYLQTLKEDIQTNYLARTRFVHVFCWNVLVKGGMFNRLYNWIHVWSKDVTLTSNRINPLCKTDAFSKYVNNHAQYIRILTTLIFTRSQTLSRFTNVLPFG